MPEPPFADRYERLLVVVAAGWSLFALHYALLGRWRTVVIDVSVVGLTVALGGVGRSVRSEPALRVLGHLAIGVSAVGLAAAAMLSGQGRAMAPWYLALAPLLAAHLHGSRSALAWTVLAAALVTAVHASEAWIQVEPEFVPQGAELAAGQVLLGLTALAFGLVARRITDRQLALAREREGVIARQKGELEHRAAQLMEARDRALEASSAKDRFLATMSHELRTPLNAIIGFARVVANRAGDGLPERERQYVDRIRLNGEHLLGLINRVLDLSKIEAGREALSVSAVALPQLVRSVAQQLEAEADQKGLALVVEVPDRVAAIEADSTKLRQVLINLIGNAIKFTPEGEVRVALRCDGADGAASRIEVSDTGPGIPADRLAGIFHPFEQVDGSSSRTHPGTGLGLAISRSLCVLMGYRLEVRSELGEGSMFWIDLGGSA